MSTLEFEPNTSDEPLPRAAPWDVEVAGHQLRLFVEAGPLLHSVLEDVRAARKRIWIESYTFAADAAGRELAEVLKQKARDGVDVRVMYDAVGSLYTANSFFSQMQAAGVKVHGFHKVGDALRRLPSFFQVFNRRNHRKLVVVDDRVAYFGGMNLVDVSDPEGAHEAPASASWRDVHVRLIGPQQALVAQAMDYLWQKATDAPRPRAKRPPWPRRRMLKAREDGIFLFDCAPGLKMRRAARVLVPLIRRAQRTITISMAYFIPTGPVIRALVRARRRGVNVRVIIPSASDVPAAYWACRHCYDKLVRHGIRIYERSELMLHSKVLVIDDDWSVIGSCNLDPRSLQWNLEYIGVIRSATLAKVVKHICAYELCHSVRVRDHHYRGRRWWQRLLDRLAWTFRRWL